jgi:PAS domain S-box-containing protein
MPFVASKKAAMIFMEDMYLNWSWFASLVGVSCMVLGLVLMLGRLFPQVAERERAERSLRESEASLTNAQRVARLGSWDWNIVTNELHWSAEIYRIFGLEPQHFGATYDAFLKSVHPDDRATVTQAVDAALTGAVPYGIDHRIVLPDGAVRTVHEQAEVAFDGSGTPVRMSGTIQDITESVRAAEALRDSEARLQHAQRVAAMGHWDWQAGENRITFSPNVASLLGIAEEDLPDLHDGYLEFVHKDDRETLKETVGRAFETTSAFTAEYRIVTPSGQTRHISEIGEPKPGAASRTVGMFGTLQDITERKRAEEEIRKLNEELEQLVEARTAELRAAQDELVRKERLAALGQLTATVSHELRNPLGAMGASVAAIKKLAGGDNKLLGRSVAVLDRSITRCDNIIGDLLDYSRVRPLEAASTALDSWLDSLLKEYAVAPGVELRRELDSGTTVALDPDRFHRVMVNLLDNACQAMTGAEGSSEGKMVLTVASRPIGDRVEISVSDTGPGIAAADRDKIFEPLFSTKSFGVGLGLAIVKRVVEQHDGGIAVESAPDQGARFIMTLPVKEPMESVA